MQFLRERPGPLGECTIPGWHDARGARPRQVATELIKAPAFKTRRPFVQQLSELSFASFHGGLKFRVVLLFHLSELTLTPGDTAGITFL